MANIQNLPDEILILIASKLDYFNLINFSSSCPEFAKLSKDTQVNKNVHVLHANTNQKSWPRFKLFLDQNKLHITYLNLSGVTWVKRTIFAKTLPKLTLLKNLNIIMTGIEMIDIEYSVNTLPLLRVVSFTYTTGNFLTRDSCPVDHLTIDLELKTLREFIWTLQIFKSLCEISIKICVRGCIPFNYLSGFLSFIPASMSTIRCKILFIDKLPLLKCKISEIKILFLTYLYEYYYVETSRGFYLSSNFCHGLTNNPFVKRLDELDADYPSTHLMGVCGISKDFTDLGDIEKFIEIRIQKRIQIAGFDIDSKCYLSKTKPMTQYMINTDSYKYLTLSSIQLCTEVEKNVKKESLLKKSKVSHIPQPSNSATSTFQDLMANKQKVEIVHIRHDLHLWMKALSEKQVSCCSEHNNITVIYDFNALHIITGLKFLKQLILSVLPNNCQLFGKNLFTNCKHLTIVEFESSRFDKTEAILDNVRFSQSIEAIHFKSQLRQIDGILNCLSLARTLRDIVISEKTDITMQPHKVTLPPLLNLVQKCKKLKSLFIYQENRPKCLDVQYRKFEKICKLKNSKLLITLTHV